MTQLKNVLVLLAIICPFSLWGQSADLPLNHRLYHYIDRLDIEGRSDATIHTDTKPYSRSSIAEIFDSIDQEGMTETDLEWFRLNRISGDDDFAAQEDGKGLLKYFYLNKRDLYSLRKEKIQLYVNPTLYLNAGADVHDLAGTGTSQTLSNYRNTRGLRIRGSLFDKVGFYTEVSENQVKYPQFVRNYEEGLDVLWGETFVKDFDQTTGNPGYDYFNARGYVTYSPVKELRFKLGRDRGFWGNGYQSLQLSDQAADYFFLNFNLRIWKLEYSTIYAQFTDYIRNKPDSYGIFPKKYGVFHQLFYKPKKWLSIGLFESVIYSPTLPGGVRGFELEYLNPLIFYRSVEQSLGSPDNSMLGLSWKLNFLQRFQYYGQLMLDDFNFRVRDQGTGYFGNKYGWQMGLKYINAFWIPRLDLQLEYNRIRPYTYQHFNPTANYSHYGQYLAHSQGANLYDFNLILRYQPFPRWSGFLGYTRMVKGLDIGGENYGGNIWTPYTDFFQEFNNTVAQGERFQVDQLYGRVSYQFLNLEAFAELEGRYRRENNGSSTSILGTLRFNLPTTPIKF